MELFWFIVIQFSFLALVSFSVHYSGVLQKRKNPPFSQDRRADWMLHVNPRTEPGIFARNLRTHEQVVFPSPDKEEVSVAWIVALFSAAVALGCLAGFVLYKIWNFVLHSSWF